MTTSSHQSVMLAQNLTCEALVDGQLCNVKSWSVEGWVQDSQSGLQDLRVDIEGDKDFQKKEISPGEIGKVSFTLSSNCCNIKAEIVAIDDKGNRGVCKIDVVEFKTDPPSDKIDKDEIRKKMIGDYKEFERKLELGKSVYEILQEGRFRKETISKEFKDALDVYTKMVLSP